MSFLVRFNAKSNNFVLFQMYHFAAKSLVSKGVGLLKSEELRKNADQFGSIDLRLEGGWYRAPSAVKGALESVFILRGGVHQIGVEFEVVKVNECGVYAVVRDMTIYGEDYDFTTAFIEHAPKSIGSFLSKLKPERINATGNYKMVAGQIKKVGDWRHIALEGEDGRWYLAPAAIQRGIESVVELKEGVEYPIGVNFDVYKVEDGKVFASLNIIDATRVNREVHKNQIPIVVNRGETTPLFLP